MIKEIHLSNWKSFKDATLHLDPLTVLIGANASGKSNLIEALDFLSRLGKGQNLKDALKGDNGGTLRGGIEYAALQGESEIGISIVIFDDDNPNVDYKYDLRVIIENQENVFLKSEKITSFEYGKEGENPKENDFFSFPDKEVSIETNKGAKSSRLQFALLQLELQQIPSPLIKKPENAETQKRIKGLKVVLDALRSLFIFNPIPHNMRSYSLKSKQLERDASNIAGFIADLTEDNKKNVEQQILKYVKNLPEKDIQSVEAFIVGVDNKDAILVCAEGWGNNLKKIDARIMSDGTLHFIAIAAAMLTLPPQTQLVIEEIDNGIHPSRAKLLIKMMKEIGAERNIDVIFTTHNSALLNNLGPGMSDFVEIIHRDPKTGHSKITVLREMETFIKLFSAGSLGEVTANGMLGECLKWEELQ